MAKAKKETTKPIPEVISDRKSLKTKRQIDIYRDDNGNLNKISLENIEIDEYTFKGLSLVGSEFIKVKFVSCLFQGSDFTDVIVKDCEFKKCDLRWATITPEQSESNVFENCLVRELNVLS